jgi:hypothetical protein
MLTYIDILLRAVLNRLNVSSSCLSHLLQVTARKTDHNAHSASPNSIILLIFEILGDGLRMKARVLPYTLGSMLKVELPSNSSCYSRK